MTDYTQYNAQNVLNNLETLIERNMSLPIRLIYSKLSIFDWWNDNISVAQMKQMRTFLKAAIERGFTGYVCFKVGASGCANGMWAYKVATTDGYSPDGDVLYRSFTPDYTYWQINLNNKWFPEAVDLKYNSCKTIKQLDKVLVA